MQLNNTPLIGEILRNCTTARHPNARELARLLNKPHVKALIQTHDEVGEIPFEEKPDVVSLTSTSTDTTSGMPSETIKMVGLRRNPSEPLGLTVEIDEHNQLMVARILAGGMIDRQGLLNPGDVILEVNGVPVSTPEQLQEQISLAKESVTLKIGPNLDEEMRSARLMMSGGQVKNGRNLDTGKKLTVSCVFFNCAKHFISYHFLYLINFAFILCSLFFVVVVAIYSRNCITYYIITSS